MIGVSGDTQETSARFREAQQLPYALVSDPKGRILARYGVKWPLVGISRRATFVIDRERRVRLAFWSELDVEAHVAQASAAVAEAVRAPDRG